MIRIGIVGSDNSHAQRFPEHINLDTPPSGFKVSGARVVCIWGEDRRRTEEVARAGNIDEIVEDPLEMLGKVDAVMVVFRHGDLHYPYAKPFIERGIPAFVDKPLAIKLNDARAMVELARRKKTLLTSYSTLRFATKTRQYIQKLKKISPVTAGISCGPADLRSEYGGIFFYGVHTVELMLATFGSGVESITAQENRGNVTAIAKYRDDKIITLQFLGNAKYVFQIIAYGKGGWSEHVVDFSTCYYEGLKVFLNMIRRKKLPISFPEMLESVAILTAVEESLKKGETVKLHELN